MQITELAALHFSTVLFLVSFIKASLTVRLQKESKVLLKQNEYSRKNKT